jgi:hypothetical protein
MTYEMITDYDEAELPNSPKQIFVACPICGGEQFHMTISRHGYTLECCSLTDEGDMCGHEIRFGGPLNMHSGQCPVSLHQEGHDVLESDVKGYHAVISDLNEGGDADRSAHGLTYREAMTFISNWFEANIPEITNLAHVPQYMVGKGSHPFTNKAYYDVWPDWAGREPIEDTAYPHKVASEHIGTIWED